MKGGRAVRAPWFSLLLPLCLAAAGCERPATLGKVHGKVTHQGQPVTAGTVVFRSDRGVNMNAPIDAEGQYRVSMAKGVGLPPGEYRVAVAPPLLDLPIGAIKAPPKPPEYPQLPKKFRQPDTSGLVLTVKEGDNEFNIELPADGSEN